MARSWKTISEWRLPDAVLLAAMLALGGCGPAGLNVVPVAGSVTLDGKPVEDAAVAFVAVDGGHLAHGVTDHQGRFALTTTNRPGAVVGEHRVVITKQNTFDPTIHGGIGEMRVEWIVPKRYSTPDTSELRAAVPAGGTDTLQFDLVSK